MRTIIYPYKIGSQTARAVARGLDGLRVWPNRRYRPRTGDKIINLGNSEIPFWMTGRARENMLNQPEAVSLAANKIKTFTELTKAGIPTLEWTTDWEVASNWDAITYVRTKLTGHSGQGIEIYGEDMALPIAPLYTKYKENCGEYRVHVFKGEVIDYRKKSRLRDNEPSLVEDLVRTHGNGWIFRQGNLRRIERIENLAKNTITALGLDFGAVDIIKDEDGNVFIVEVNSCPAMEGSTLEAYLTKFKLWMNQ